MAACPSRGADVAGNKSAVQSQDEAPIEYRSPVMVTPSAAAQRRGELRETMTPPTPPEHSRREDMEATR